MSDELSFEEAVESYIDVYDMQLNTVIPARIVSYNPSLQKCSCQPLINTLLRDERIFELGTIEDVPVVFPASNRSAMTFPLEVGDSVLILFSQRSLDVWLDSAIISPVNPKDFRKHDMSDAIVIPGLFPFPRAINDPLKHTLIHDTDDLVVSHNIGTSKENEVRLKSDGTIRLRAGSGATLTMNLDGTISLEANTTLTVTVPSTNWIGDINQTGTFTSDTDVIANGISLIGHVHPQGADSAGNTQVNTGVAQ